MKLSSENIFILSALFVFFRELFGKREIGLMITFLLMFTNFNLSGQVFTFTPSSPVDLNNANGSCATPGTSGEDVFSIPVTGVGTLSPTNVLKSVKIVLSNCGSGTKNFNSIQIRIQAPNGSPCLGIYSGGLSISMSNTYAFSLLSSTTACLNYPNPANGGSSGGIDNVSGNSGLFKAQFNAVPSDFATFNGVPADGNWKLIFSVVGTSFPPCFVSASLEFGGPITVINSNVGDNCSNPIVWDGSTAYCLTTSSKSASIQMPGILSPGFGTIGGQTCDWNAINNNDVWIKHTATSTYTCLSISGISPVNPGDPANLQSIVVTDANLDFDNNPCTGPAPSGENDPRWQLVSCPRNAIYSTPSGTTINQQHCFTSIPGKDYFFIVDGSSVPTTTGQSNTNINFFLTGSTPCNTPTVNTTQPSCPVATGSITVTSPLGSEYQYSVDDGVTYQSSPTFSPLDPRTYKIKVKNINANCTSAATDVVINPLPSIPWANTQFPATGAICSNDNFLVYGQVNIPGVTEGAGPGSGITAQLGYSTSNTNPSGSGWTWIDATYNSQGSGSGSNNDEYKGTLSGLSAGTYYYAFRYKLNCGAWQYGGYSASGGGTWNGTSNVNGSLTIRENPTSSDAGSTQNICEGTTATLSANSPSVGTGQWTIVSGGTGTFSDASSPSSTFTPTAAGTYVLRWTISNGSCTSSSDVTINVTSGILNFVNTQFPGSASICQGGTVTIYGQVYEPSVTEAAGQGSGITAEYGYSSTNTDPSSASWTWTSATYLGQGSSPNGNNDEFSATFGAALPPGSYFYAFRYRLNGCAWQYGGYSASGGGTWNGTSNVNGSLTIRENPTSSDAGSTQNICEGTTATLSANSPFVGTGQWTIVSGGTGAFSDASSPSSTFTPTAAGTYVLRWTISNGSCTSFSEVTINVTSGILNFVNTQFPGNATICLGQTANVYGQVFEPSVTPGAGQGANIEVQVGYNNTNNDPSTWSGSNWVNATYNAAVIGNNDEYIVTFGSALSAGTYYYAFRYRLNGCTWQYGGYSIGGGGTWDGTNNINGVLTIYSNTTTAMTPSSICAGVSNIAVTGSNAGSYELFVNGISQGVPSATNSWTIPGPLSAGNQVCVRGYAATNLITMDGLFTEPFWSPALVNSAGGAASGTQNRINALYVKNAFGYLNVGIAGKLVYGEDRKILLFVDSKTGGYNDLLNWSTRTNSPNNGMKNLKGDISGSIQFDPGFSPDFIISIGTNSAGESFLDFYDMVSNSNNYLGSTITQPTRIAYQANLNATDYSRGYEIKIPSNLFGTINSPIKFFAMLTNNPPDNDATTLSNQFLSPASNGEGDYGNGAVNYGNAVPNPVSYVLESDCYTEVCRTVVAATTPNFEPVTPICSGGSFTPPTSTNGITGTWTPALNNTQTTTYTFTPTPGLCANPTTMEVKVNPSPSISPISTTICSGTAFSVTPVNGTVPSGTTYTWSVATNTNVTGQSAQASAQSSISQTLTNSSSSNQNVVYTVTATSGSCTSTFTVTVTVLPPLTTGTVQGITTGVGPNNLVIYQVYGGGGSGGATYPNDFVVLYNPTASAVNLSGWSLQYASATSTSITLTTASQIANLSGTINSGGYFLIALASGTGTTVLPTPDITNTSIAVQVNNGKVFLCNSTSGIVIGANGCSSSSNIVDFVGFGTANCSEGGSPVTGLNTTNWATRKLNGCQDTDVNSADFTAGTATIRNSSPPTNFCTTTSNTETICAGQNVSSITVTAASGANGTFTYQWYSRSGEVACPTGSSTTGWSLIDNATSLTYNPGAVSTTTTFALYVTATGANSCGGAWATDCRKVVVNPAPAITNMTATICSGSAFTATPVNGTNGTVPSGTTYSWAAPSVVGISGTAAGTNASTISGSITNTTSAPIDVAYTVTPTNGTCPGSTFTLTVTVNPNAAVNNMNTSTCTGVSATITPTNGTNGIIPNGTTFSWTSPTQTGVSGGIAGSGTSLNASLTGSGTAVYTFTPTSGSCPGSNFTVTITVEPCSPFQSCNLVVYRVGDGSTTLNASTTSAFPVAIQEISPIGQQTVQTISGLFTGANLLTQSGNATSVGMLNSYNGFLAVPGLNSSVGTLKASSENTKVTHVIDGSATLLNRVVHPSSSTPLPFLNNTFRSVIPLTNNSFYASGVRGSTDTDGEIWYYNGDDNSNPWTLIFSSTYTLRNIEIFNGNLYFSTGNTSALNPKGIYQVGTGLPTTINQTASNVLASGSESDPYGFSISPDGCTAYIANESGGIQKFVKSTSWSLAYSFITNTRGLVVDYSGSNPIIYATSTASSNNSVIKIIDQGASSTISTIANSGANFRFAGIDFTPNSTITAANPISTQPISTASLCNTQTQTLSVTASGSNTYQWYSNTVNSICGATAIVGTTSASYTPPVAASSGTTYYFVKVVTNCYTIFYSNIAAVTTTINPTPTASNNSPFCSGQNNTLTLSTPNLTGATFSWSGPNSFSSNAQNPTVTTNATNIHAGVYNLVTTVNDCNSSAGTTTVIINQPPSIKATSPP
jgi:hypothetical protein